MQLTLPQLYEFLMPLRSSHPTIQPFRREAQLTTELFSTMAVAAQDNSFNHAITLLRQQSTTAASPSIDQEDSVPKETKPLEHLSKAQSAKTYSSDSDLWDKALR